MSNNKRRDEWAQQYRYNSNRTSTRYTAQSKGKLRQIAEHVSRNPNILRNLSERLGRKGIALSLAAVLAISSIAGCSIAAQDHESHSTTPPIETIIKDNSDLEDLGITESDYNELQEIKNSINSELSQEELNKLGDRLENLELSIGKSKVANSLDISANKITLNYYNATNASPSWQAVVVKSDSKFRSQGYNGLSYLDTVYSSSDKTKKSISPEIASYISEIARLQSIENFTLDDLQNSMLELEKFATCDIQIDADGNLIANSQRLQDNQEEILPVTLVDKDEGR